LRATPQSDGPHSIVPDLRSRLANRLAELESEAQLLQNAIAALDREPGAATGDSLLTSPPTPSIPVVRTLHESPGVRASMVALITGLSPAAVNSALVDLEAAGKATRVGLGWCLVPG
jgi:hypothetical protein